MIFNKVYIALIAKIIRLFSFISKRIKSKYEGHILMFHTISPVKDVNDVCDCSYDYFEKRINYFINNNYEFLSMDSVADIISRKLSKRFVSITFDDTSLTVFKNAFPLLKKHRIPFTIYVAYNLINSTGMLTELQIKEMLSSGLCTLGAHSMSHVKLIGKYIDYNYEIKEIKLKLETKFSTRINHFAYPYGQPYQVSLKAIRTVSKVGYKTAVSSVNLPLKECTSFKYYLPRELN
ncbi:polysaccharide deacetylase [Prevotella herbatica]|uniref:Polysaccharide deacetylase n=1 Tax=Prevotella herbatica TaxID=2801997 RepID=A0ABM7NZ91_9BACT|nr:polysaccharide deacetylase family protein [Prevotella herbatica]BCS85734.1 polysaccharide deacetylase [Prevotella herbatica]